MSRWLVTGCGGFIGSHLCEALIVRGDQVYGVDGLTGYYPDAQKKANLAWAVEQPTFEWWLADLANVSAVMRRRVDLVDGVFHLAAQPGVRGSWGEGFERYVRDNVLATQRVFEACLHAGKRAVFASSSSVYGNAAAYPTAESVVPVPVSPYGVTKLACEHLAAAYMARGLRVVGLRYFTVYGPRQRPDMAFHRLIQAALDNEPFTVYGSGLQTRDATFVADAVDATVRAMDSNFSGFFNVGGGQEETLMEAARIVALLTERVIDFRYEPTRPGDVRRTSADWGLALAAFGWAPRTTLDEGLRAQVEWQRGR